MASDEDRPLIEELRRFDPSRLFSHGTSLATAAAAHPVFRRVQGMHLVNMLTWTPIQEHMFPDHMLRLMRNGVTAEDAVASTLAFARSPSTDLLSVGCIHGVRVPGSIRLSDRCSLERSDDLPKCDYRDKFFIFSDGSMPNCTDPFFEPPRAYTAIVVSSNFSPAIRETIDPVSSDWMLGEFNAVSDEVGAAYVALVAAGAPVELGYRFTHATNPGYPSESSGVTLAAISRRHHHQYEADGERLREIYALVRAFPAPSEISRLASRLGRARCQSDPVDAHLDFGIVAESILTHGEREQGEIRFRLSTRAAWLLGESQDTRVAIARRMKRLYELRSSAAHEGRLPVSGKRAWSKADRLDCDRLCGQLLTKVLQDGGFPTDWDSISFGNIRTH